MFFVGDGPSDYRAIEVADFSFIRKDTRAINFCEENDIKYKEFDSFNDVLEYYRENEVEK